MSMPLGMFASAVARGVEQRRRLLPRPGFFQPAQPMLAPKPLAGPDWMHEAKHDGYRLLARKDAGHVTLWSPYGVGFTEKLTSVAESARSLPIEDPQLDSDAVAFKPDGHSDFAALRTTRGVAQASFVAFDLLQFDGEDWRKLALEIRRAADMCMDAALPAAALAEYQKSFQCDPNRFPGSTEPVGPPKRATKPRRWSMRLIQLTRTGDTIRPERAWARRWPTKDSLSLSHRIAGERCRDCIVPADLRRIFALA